MAATFTLETAKYSTRYMYVTCTQTKNITNNTSTINWTLTVTGGNNNYYSTGPTTLTINGQQVYYSARKEWDSYTFPAAKGSVSGSLTVSHNNDGNKKINVSLSTAIYWGTVNTVSKEWTLDVIPRQANIVSAPNFNDEQSPTITYSNPAGTAATTLQACISLTGAADDIAYRDISKTGTSYTFPLTENERNILQNATLSGSNTRVVYFIIKTVIGGATFYSPSEAKVLTIVNAAPVVAPTVTDRHPLSVELTGDSGVMISGYNELRAACNARALKGATITSYKITNGDSVVNAATGDFNYTANNVFIFTVTDNRGLTTTVTYTMPMVSYIPVTCNLGVNAELVGETGAKMLLTISGRYFNGSFGAKNNVLRVEYRYKQNGGEYSDWIGVTIPAEQISNNTYTTSFEALIDIFYKDTYQFQAIAYDLVKTTGTYSIEVVGKALPVFDWSGTDFNFNVPVTIEGNSLADYVIDTGTESMGNNGTWYWSKWKSGKAECYGCRNYGDMAVMTAWGGLYRSESFSQSLPSELFIDTPEVIDVTYRVSNYGGWIAQHEGTAPSSSNTGGFIVVRPASATLNQARIGFHVIGRWKE